MILDSYSISTWVADHGHRSAQPSGDVHVQPGGQVVTVTNPLTHTTTLGYDVVDLMCA